jgi:SAM-dependent methyltransferase
MKTSLLCLALLSPLGAYAVEDVPFVVTPDNVTVEMLKIAKVGPADYVIDLGSGDGRIVIVAAKQFGARGLGVEIDPGLVKVSKESAKKAGVADRAEFREQDLFLTDLKPASVVTLYLLPDVNLQLRPNLLGLKPGTRIVSHDWDMGEWKPDSSVTVPAPEKKIGRGKTSTVHFWVVPAKIHGAWCAQGSWKGIRLDLDQKFQEVAAKVSGGEFTTPQTFNGRINANSIRAETDPMRIVAMTLDGDVLRVDNARGTLLGIWNASFVRASSGKCA